MADLAAVRGLVLDASVLINLLATQECATIVTALGVPCLAVEQSLSEVTRDPVSRQNIANIKMARRRLHPVELFELDEQSTSVFLNLVAAAPPNGLGDGEAASIAACGSLGYAACLDDRKARRIFQATYQRLPVYWTVDLLRHPNVIGALGEKRAADCFRMARQFGRMTLPR